MSPGLSARCAGRSRQSTLEELTAAAEIRRVAGLVWGIFRQDPMWGRERIAMALRGLGVFVAASTVRNILLRPRPRRSSPGMAAAKGLKAGPRQVVARCPNHVWSIDRTRVWRWGIWPTWALVAVDHSSLAATAVVALEGSNAGWVVGASKEAFPRHGPPRRIVTNQEGVFTSEVFAELLRDWDVRPRFGAVDRHGSTAVAERAILTLKHEWLWRIPVIRGLDHLSRLLDDFSHCHHEWRGHSTIGGTAPSVIHCGAVWERPARAAKTVSGLVEQRSFPDVRVTAFRQAAWSQAGVTGPCRAHLASWTPWVASGTLRPCLETCACRDLPEQVERLASQRIACRSTALRAA